MEADSGKGDAEQALFDDDEDEDESAGSTPKGANGSAPVAREKRVLETEQHRKSSQVRLVPLALLSPAVPSC